MLFFSREKSDTDSTKETWVYDLRTNMPSFGKRTPLTHAHFAEFEKCYGRKSDGTSKRTDQGETGRWRPYKRSSRADLPEPEEITATIRARLGEALDEMDALAELLEMQN